MSRAHIFRTYKTAVSCPAVTMGRKHTLWLQVGTSGCTTTASATSASGGIWNGRGHVNCNDVSQFQTKTGNLWRN